MKRTLNKDTAKLKGKKVRVCGWVESWRDHGKLVFIDLRDRTGILQVVFAEKTLAKEAKKIRPEWVLEIEGGIKERPPKTKNKDLATGGLEMEAEKLEILNPSKTPPFDISGEKEKIDEEKRLRYRYLDLRRKGMQENLKIRQKVINFMREYLAKDDFVEIETPILTKSTPEGARDFIVPSRLQPGNFYALPQSPQQYKQLLMVSGFEKYFQIARCFRDEDPRADRQAEFTQLDIEIAFVEQKDILGVIEKLYMEMVKKLFPEKKIAKVPFPRLTYKEVMKKYKSDKPDLRKNKKDPNELAFAFIVDFPMFEWREEDPSADGSGQGRWDAVHHPFTRPQTEDMNEIIKNPEKILAWQYDFVLNGYEIGGGSLRSYKTDFLEAVFKVMGHKKEEIRKKFGHLLKAFQYGAPPHGGIAPGIDRFLSVILNEPNIRETIAFPKTGDGRDFMMQAPSEVDKKQLKELHIETIKKKKKQK
jgi:aspartyl-tRNA synthetase